MSKDDSTVDLFASVLLTSDVREELARHGVRARIEVVDEQGAPLAPSSHQTVLHGLAKALQRSEHTKRLATVGSMAAGVTHEARNLLTGVIGFSQVLQQKSKDAESKDMLRAIENEARRCVELLTDYLKLSRSRIESTRTLQVSEIVSPIERLVSHQLRMRGCSLAIQLSDGLPRVAGSCSELQRVVINLVMNAADATGSGGHILVVADSPDGQYVNISVIDDGPGVPPELRERIFEAFFSTKGADEGTGLGLALSRSIVEAHRGELLLEPDSGCPGSTFTMRLPAYGVKMATA
jgi:signal transduction histidine kinase